METQDIHQERPDESRLHLAAARDDRDEVENQIALGADVNAQNDNGLTPLHMASSRPVVLGLVQAGASLDARDENGFTPLHMAVRKGHVEAARTMLAHGAFVNARDNKDRTPLHKAALNGQFETVEFLLKHGADPDALDGDGNTALDWALSMSHSKVARLLGGVTSRKMSE